MSRETAILLAAGQGMRMRPLTQTVPKPLIRVNGSTLIETVIHGLRERGVQEICVVTGYLKEQFHFLKETYSGITLVENQDYMEKNNISSLYAAREMLGGADCFICEADLYVRDNQVFELAGGCPVSCYLGEKAEDDTDDWVFQTEGKRIIGISKGGKGDFCMTGISCWKKKDALHIRKALEKAYLTEGSGNLFWDEVVDRELNRIHVAVCTVAHGSITEVDTPEQLRRLERTLQNSVFPKDAGKEEGR